MTSLDPLPSSTSSRYVPRTPWHAAPALLAAIALFIAAQVGTYVLLTLMGVVDGPPSGPIGSGYWRDALLLWMLCSQVLLVVLTLAAATVRGGRMREVLHLYPVAPSVLIAAIGGLVALLVVVNAIAFFVNPDAFFADLRTFQPLIQSQGWWIAAVAIGLGAPLSEELLFRGFLFSALARGAGVVVAALITNSLWTAMHIGYSPAGLVEVFLVGLYFSWLLWRTGSLWPALVCHAAANVSYLAMLRWLLPPLPA